MFAGISAVILATSLASAADAKTYAGHRLVAIDVDHPADLAELEQMGVDIWTERVRTGSVVARVPPTRWPLLAASAFRVRVVNEDLGPAVHAEHVRVTTDPVADQTDAFFDDYRDLDEIYNHLNALAQGTDDASLVVIGQSVEGRDIVSVELTAPDPNAPVILINAGQHAREWISHATATCIVDELITRSNDPSIASLREQVTFAIVPVVNPDGYAYSWSDERFWRKNRQGATGVDTNRNFGVAWGGSGASADPEAGNYHGEAPFSEPETLAFANYARSFDHLRTHVDIHSFGQVVLYPWGFDDDQLAPADDELRTMAEDLAASISASRGTDYSALRGALLYPASGNMMDWSYGELGAYASTIELRPEQSKAASAGFELPPEQIRDVCQEAMAGVINLADFTINAAPGAPGDSTGAGGGETGSLPGDSTGGGQGGSTSGGTTTGENTGGDEGPTSSPRPPQPTTAGTDSLPGGSSTAGAPPTSSDTNDLTSDDPGGCSCTAPLDRRSGPAWLWLLVFGFGLRRPSRPQSEA